MSPTTKKHLDAITRRGQVTKSNVIGIRKILNHAERLYQGLSGNRVNATEEDASELIRAIRRHEPEVTGELHESGLKLLRSPRWRRRFNERETGIIERLYRFGLARFDYIDGRAIPVYKAIATTGQSFLFRNIPWQTAYYSRPRQQSGPVVVE